MIKLKFILLFTILLVLHINGLDQIKKDKISKNVFNRLGTDLNNTLNIDDQIKLWIFFNSKDYIIENKQSTTSTGQTQTPSNQYKQIQSITGVNDDSIKRRSKRSINKKVPIFDETDLPVSEKFIKEIINDCNLNHEILSIKLLRKSNWLNSISIITTDKTIDSNDKSSSSSSSNENFQLNKVITCISNKKFVESIDLVSKLLNPQSGQDEIKEIRHHRFENSKNNNINDFNNPISKLLGHVKLLSSVQDDSSTIKYDKSFYGESFQGISQTSIDKLQRLGYDGYGLKIIVMDTGFYKDHDAFKHLKIIGEHNFIDNTNDTQEDPVENEDPRYSQNFHGTATLSVLGGFIPGKLVGAAYNASYLLAKTEIVEGEDTVIEEDNWIAALEWGEKLGASIISSSLSYQLYNYPEMNGKDSHLTKAANLAIYKGMIVVNSMGNKDYSIFGAPADGENVISVGAVDSSGRYAPFSSIGPTADGRIKPDIMALGVGYYIALSTSRSSFSSVDGTSFACPLVASGIALLMQAHPDWNTQQIYQAVLSTGSKASNPDPYVGFGVFNALGAYNFRPSVGDCYSTGCSNHGICCSSQCQCAPGYYGKQCQYKRVECGYRCQYDFNSICQSNNLGPSYTCVSQNDTANAILNQDPFSILFCKKSDNPTSTTTTPKPSTNFGGLIRIVISL
ncbi:hypothetical protein DDB_G0288363 [Dictyostelium discoideum AX4]|uniref:Peptidase S8/S53 domain-containing protein n=1 Tax=Dictyostelium discoideum TaxID=44689 RepID=Q54J39_DICDI|nr:hypothetical protein DDB_G0288363 [Dictyostelium discoideum AX4]EAL63278.1 hypothetical protein DDB_G0288363 [Dictyostelium discoideum AX4]|eukprot:XP_636762.1 hypothetical protein DDB_G0288363 [Dictyostelium discoideum AX4]